MSDTPPNNSENAIAWLRFARIPLFGPVLIKRAVDSLGSPESVLNADATRLAMIEDIGPKRAESFARARDATLEPAQRELEEAHTRNIQILTRDHPAWPPGLIHLNDPPIVLYARGNLTPHDAVALGIVGARKCTLYGREQAERFGALLAGAGITVISGGARGIDTGAHLGALRAKGRTVVVQGCGLGHCYPEENAELYERIVNEEGGGAGAVISELPLDTPPIAENFPPRNRIIAGMSLGILVVEANERSGSLITARLAAADYGREVFALPGRVDSPASAGTHQLIKKGMAHLVENLADILEALGDVGTALSKTTQPKASHSQDAPSNNSPNLFESVPLAEPAISVTITTGQKKILAALHNAQSNGHTVDDICDHTELSPAIVMAELTMLQIRGLITRAPNNRFATKTPPNSPLLKEGAK